MGFADAVAVADAGGVPGVSASWSGIPTDSNVSLSISSISGDSSWAGSERATAPRPESTWFNVEATSTGAGIGAGAAMTTVAAAAMRVRLRVVNCIFVV